MKNKETKHRVEEVFLKLKALKDWIISPLSVELWKSKSNSADIYYREDNEDYRTQVSTIVKRQKDAEFSSNLPEFSFIPLDDNARKTRKIVREAWKHHWLTTNSDKTIHDAIKSSTTFWTWIVYEWIAHIKRKIRTPYKEDWIIKFKEEELIDSKIFSELIPFENFFINGTDIDNATEAIIFRIYDKNEYIWDRKDNPIYKNISTVEKTKPNNVIYYDMAWKEKKWADNPDDDYIVELEYFNKAKDEYIILANWIEILNSSIPYYHKELPFALFYDNTAEGRIWGIWEYELLREDERAKDEYRRLTIQAVKASLWTTIIDAWSDIDISTTFLWIGQILETDDIDWIRHFAPSIPIWAIAELEWKIDNDIISKSWVDFKALHLTPNESATKTANKQNSTRKRINLNMRDNAFNFFRRLWKLRLANIQLLHEIEPLEIVIEGWSITPNGILIKDEADAYGSASVWQTFIEWNFLVVPLIETMLWDNTSRRKENLITYMQLAWNLMWSDGKPVIKAKQLAKLATDEYWYDFEKLTEESEDAQSPDDILNDIFNEWPAPQQNPAMDPNYIPPSQRSWAKQNVQAISWQAKIRPEEE